jgi:putative endonuclease
MQEGDELVFVEVRYRRSVSYGSAAETIGTLKQRRLLHCARLYRQQQPLLAHYPYRFDVVTLERTLTHCMWLKNAMTWDDAWT